MSMVNGFRQALNDGRYREEWNDLSPQEKEKFEKSGGAFTGYAHFVEVRESQDRKAHKKWAGDLTY